jgi:hypothetical protein
MNSLISPKFSYIYFRALKAAVHAQYNVTELCQGKLRLKNSVIRNVAIGLVAGAKTSYVEESLKVQTETPRRCGPAECLQEVAQALRGVTIGENNSSALEYKYMPRVAKILLVINFRS